MRFDLNIECISDVSPYFQYRSRLYIALLSSSFLLRCNASYQCCYKTTEIAFSRYLIRFRIQVMSTCFQTSYLQCINWFIIYKEHLNLKYLKIQITWTITKQKKLNLQNSTYLSLQVNILDARLREQAVSVQELKMKKRMRTVPMRPPTQERQESIFWKDLVQMV